MGFKSHPYRPRLLGKVLRVLERNVANGFHLLDEHALFYSFVLLITDSFLIKKNFFFDSSSSKTTFMDQ